MTTVVAVEKQKLAKPPLEIHYLGDRVLRQPAKRISKVNDEIRQLSQKMLQTMYSSNGIGLAAPQVAVNKQLIVVDCEIENSASPPIILINPQIKKHSDTFCRMEEGCLSIPGVYLDVIRPEAIEVSYKNEQGKLQTLKASGLLARVIQHEMDHLNGVMFVDRVDNPFALTLELQKNGFSVDTVKPID